MSNKIIYNSNSQSEEPSPMHQLKGNKFERNN